METYLTLLYVTLDQEIALKRFFAGKGWSYCKPDLSILTDAVGPAKKPSSHKTKSGKIITYISLEDEQQSKPKVKQTRVRTARNAKQKANQLQTASNDESVGSQTWEALDGSHLSDGFVEQQATVETDDGDNDDDFASDVEEAMKAEQDMVTPESEVPISTRSRRKPDRKTPKTKKSPQVTVDKESSRLSPARKKRKVAIETEAKIEAFIADEQEKTDVKPGVLVKNRTTNEKRTNASIPGFQLSCSECGKEFKMKRHLEKHYENKHVKADTAPKPARKREAAYQCAKCGAVFSRSDSLKNHNRYVHEGIRRKLKVRPCTCDICGAVFRRISSLSEHSLTKHSTEDLPFKCDLCEKSFVRLRFLESHKNRVHLHLKPYSCTNCNAKFYSSNGLRTHTRSHVCGGDEWKKFQCPHCPNKYRAASELEMHMTALHYGGAYSCVCGEVVKWAGSIAKHQRKCKTYQDYCAAVGEKEVNRMCNVIEVALNDVLSKGTTETVTESNNTTSNEIQHENGDLESSTVDHVNSQSDRVDSEEGTSD